MLDFTYAVSTKILFGKNQIQHLIGELTAFGTRILLVYGSGSIKKNKVHQTITSLLEKSNVTSYELSGVLPNPQIQSVRQGVCLCRQHDIDGVLAVGGGSVIDCAKAIATGVYYPDDPWEMFLVGDSSVQKALPIGTVLTITGTGSEMNGNAVISNEKTQQKLAIHKDVLRPKFSILDPTYTFTVPAYYTAAGTVDIFSHILEQYFSPTMDAFVQNRLSEALLKTCITYGPVAYMSPTNYEARAQLMWTSSLALNGLLTYGRVTDWATHAMEHALSAVYGVTHGAGLAILIPFWMEHVLQDDTLSKFVEYSSQVWGLSSSDERSVATKGITKTTDFFKKLGMPTRLREVGVKEDRLVDLAEKSVRHGTIGKFKKLTKEDVLCILRAAY